jgi:hypothetical protein
MNPWEYHILDWHVNYCPKLYFVYKHESLSIDGIGCIEKGFLLYYSVIKTKQGHLSITLSGLWARFLVSKNIIKV